MMSKGARMYADENGMEADRLTEYQPQRIDIDSNVVECWVMGEGRGSRFETPWGVIEVEEAVGGGQVVGVEAWADFDLLLHTGATSFLEHLSPGRRRLLLTVLDRTDVVAIPP
jgi:hypothetical protein